MYFPGPIVSVQEVKAPPGIGGILRTKGQGQAPKNEETQPILRSMLQGSLGTSFYTNNILSIATIIFLLSETFLFLAIV